MFQQKDNLCGPFQAARVLCEAGVAEQQNYDRLWTLVVDELEPAEARAIAFASALVAAEQGPAGFSGC